MGEVEQGENVPSYFLLKVRKGDRYHYIFAELVASCNYTIDGSNVRASDTDEGELLPQKTLDEMIERQRSLAREADVEVEDSVVVTDPGGARSAWTHGAVRKQSFDNLGPIGGDG